MTSPADPLPEHEIVGWVRGLATWWYGKPDDDLISDGLLGYHEATEKWDPSRYGDEAVFKSFARKYVHWRMRDGWRVRLHWSRHHGRQLGSDISIETIVRHEGETLRLGDMLGVEDMDLEEVEVQQTITSLLDELPETEREVIVSTLLDGESLERYGKRHGYTESRACQIRTRATRRLRAEFLRSVS